MQEISFSALVAGILSGSFYYVYTSLQIPVGILFDRYNARTLLSFNAAFCALGCFVFASGHQLSTLILGRLLIGTGSAFAFIGLSHMLREHFPIKQYAFMVGLSETLGFTLTVSGMIGLGKFVSYLSWRYFIVSAGCIGLLIACCCWLVIPNNTPKAEPPQHYSHHLFFILKNKLTWLNGLFAGLEFAVVTVFGAMWAVPFLQVKLNCNLATASNITSLLLLGAGLSCPIYGKLSIHFKKRKPFIYASCLLTASFMLLVLYLPITNSVVMGFLFFLVGLCCGAYMLAYSISNELAPPHGLSTCTGFTNTLAMLTAPLLQPVVGYILDCLSTKPDAYTLANYQNALLILPAALVLACFCAAMLPESEK